MQNNTDKKEECNCKNPYIESNMCKPYCSKCGKPFIPTPITDNVREWEKEFEKLAGQGYKYFIGNADKLKSFISHLLSQQDKEIKKEIWLEVQKQVAIFAGDTAKDVGTRVGNYFLSILNTPNNE